MIPFYVVSVVWVATLAVWQVREIQHAKERMEMMKLFRAQSLSDYTAQERQAPVRRQNFMQESIKKAYDDLLGDDDD